MKIFKKEEKEYSDNIKTWILMEKMESLLIIKIVIIKMNWKMYQQDLKALIIRLCFLCLNKNKVVLDFYPSQ